MQNIISISECYDSLFIININDKDDLWEITTEKEDFLKRKSFGRGAVGLCSAYAILQ